MKIHERAKGPKDKKKEATSTSAKKEVKKEKQAVIVQELNGFADEVEAEDLVSCVEEKNIWREVKFRAWSDTSCCYLKNYFWNS